jgi:hypothetical protein
VRVVVEVDVDCRQTSAELGDVLGPGPHLFTSIATVVEAGAAVKPDVGEVRGDLNIGGAGEARPLSCRPLYVSGATTTSPP